MEESHGLDINSGAGILVMCPTSRRILLALRTPNTEWEGNTWCTLGGMMQNAETPLDGALRECLEESEIKPDEMIRESFFVDQKKPNTGFKFYNFIGKMNEEIKPTINDEHTDYNWYRLNELPRLKNLHSGLKRMFEDERAVEMINQQLHL